MIPKNERNGSYSPNLLISWFKPDIAAVKYCREKMTIFHDKQLTKQLQLIPDIKICVQHNKGEWMFK